MKSNDEYALYRISGMHGNYYVGDTAEHTGEWTAFVVLEDAIVDTLEIDSADMVTAYNISGVTLPAGSLWTAKRAPFDKIQLVSGNVQMVNE